MSFHFLDADRRTELRVGLCLQATLTVLAGGDSLQLAAIAVNISTKGLKIRLSEFLPRGLYVEVRWPSVVTFGTVVYCQPEGKSEYTLGIQTTQMFYRPKPSEAGHLSQTSAALLNAGYFVPHEAQILRQHLESCAECRMQLEAPATEPSLAYDQS